MRGWSEGIRVLLSVVLAVVLLTVLVFSLDTAAISAALLDADWSILALAAGCALFARSAGT
ncbi:hypothetical protein ACFQH8_11560 [Halomicroarcula sp. GCM10025710]